VLGAEREILASAFLFGDDPFTLTSLALLREASRRGVEVRLLVDAQWNRMPRPVIAHLQSEGIEIREYHRFRFDRLSWIFRRMHDKLLVVDGVDLVTGGRNVESPYFGFGRQVERRNYLDLDLHARGPVAGDARAYFERIWGSRHVSPVRVRAGRDAVAAAAADLDRHHAWLAERIAAARADPDRVSQPLAEVGPMRFLHDPIGKRRRSAGGVAPELRDLLAGARESVLVESPYLILSRALRRSLFDAVDRGVRVRILTNSLATTDNLWAQAGYVGHRREIVAAGIELWEYSGPECLHGKAAVIDGRTVVVGSYNLDPRSEHLNSETALVAEDETLAAELAGVFEAHLAHAWRIDERGWPEGHDTPYPNVSRAKRCKLRWMRLLVPLVRGQL
jgi:phosphatidylserine/phosphatidylglycerophosphate/cardiolipin synthase-like enzyme